MKLLIILSCFCALLVKGEILTNTGYYVSCILTNYGCQTCYENLNKETLCDSCQNGYQLINNSCQYDVTLCTNSLGGACNIPNCLKQSSETQCSECISGFSWISDSNECQFYCVLRESFYYYSTANWIKDQSTCHQQCPGNTNCDKCTYQYEVSCIKCSSGYFLYQKTCVNQCPASTFANEYNSCIPCPPQCDNCVSATTCTFCNEDLLTSPPSCACPNGSYYYKYNCVNSCPLNHQLIDGICVRLCQDNYYPFFTSTTEYNCQSVNSWNNDYCYNSISELSSLITISSGGNDMNNLHLIVDVREIPSGCLTFYIYGISQAISSPSSYTQINGVLADIYVPNSYILNPDYFTCSLKSCLLHLNIYMGGQIQYIYSIKVSINLKVVVSNTLTYTGEVQKVDIVCLECVIPQEKTLASSLVINCLQDQTCAADSLTTITGSTISVIQKVDDPVLKNNTIMPHSLRFSGNFQGYSMNIYITNYKFDNSIPGEITFTFSAVGVQSGTVEIVSYIINANIDRRLLDSSSQLPVSYPTHSFNLNIEEIKESESQDSQAGLYGGIAGGACLMLVIFAVFYIKKMRKSASVGIIQSQQVDQKDVSQGVSDLKKDQEISQFTENCQNGFEVPQQKDKSQYAMEVSFDRLNK